MAGHLVELATAHGSGLVPEPPTDAGWYPESPALRFVGIPAEPLPRLLRTAVAPVIDLLEDLS